MEAVNYLDESVGLDVVVMKFKTMYPELVAHLDGMTMRMILSGKRMVVQTGKTMWQIVTPSEALHMKPWTPGQRVPGSPKTPSKGRKKMSERERLQAQIKALEAKLK